MSTSVWTGTSDLSLAADNAVNTAVRLWFLVAVAGQLIFLLYVVAFYGGSAIHGNLEAWNQVLPHGYTRGNILNNVAVAAHLSLAAVVIAGGPLQLIPQIRRHAPAFHRWNGRLYVLTLFVMSMTGLYMVWSRERADIVRRAGITLDAALIMIFAILAVRYAIAGEITAHRRWALRLFMVVNAGWFFRIGLLQWVFLHNFDPRALTSPFLTVLSFADYALPLVVLEIYLRTRNQASVGSRFALAAGLVMLTVVMAIGIHAAASVLWLPHITRGAAG